MWDCQGEGELICHSDDVSLVRKRKVVRTAMISLALVFSSWIQIVSQNILGSWGIKTKARASATTYKQRQKCIQTRKNDQTFHYPG